MRVPRRPGCRWVALVLGVLSVAASGQVQYEDLKLLPADGAAGDEFGYSVAIADGVVAVGAPSSNDNGPYSGSAYLFDAETGAQLAKLLPSDGAAYDFFGRSIAIAGGVVAVGAPGHGENGWIGSPGATYTFDATTGAQLAKLIPADSEPEDIFGAYVAIADGVVAVRALGFDLWYGKAYLFDAATGTQLHKLVPADGSMYFLNVGQITIADGVVAVGSPADFGGRVFLFDMTTGAELNVLTPSGLVDWGGFASYIAMDDGLVAVSGWDGMYLFDATTGIQLDILSLDGPSAMENGVVAVGPVLYDTATGTQQIILVQSDEEMYDYFGNPAIADGVVAVGARWDDDNGEASGSAYVFRPDRDHDGLLDDWEINGIPYTGASGDPGRFDLPGADPDHKDLYVEVDAMSGFGLSDGAVALLADAFADAPRDNPDGTEGITLHVLRDDTDLNHVPAWATDGCWPIEFEVWRDNWFGTRAERDGPDRAALLGAKAKAYRYCILADRAGSKNYGGCGQLGGDNFVIYLGSRGYSDKEQAGLFMHELGHNLGLDDGGGDDVICKTNYPSVMNYLLTFPYPFSESFWELDYSRQDAGQFPVLDEQSLDETAGIGTSSGYYSDYQMPFGVNDLDDHGVVEREVRFAELNVSVIDFGDQHGTMFQDGDHSPSGVIQDLNDFGDPLFQSEPDERFTPHGDWASIRLKPAAALGAGAPAISFSHDELTVEMMDWIATNIPVPPGRCPADLNDDGLLDLADVLAFAIAFLNLDPIADSAEPYGLFDLADIIAFVVEFNAGCG